ncbi:MAG: chromate transporter [Erysipelotrichaceae bacterium]|nr:chromate transporter [Erysipelotrichaceae bacterium]
MLYVELFLVYFQIGLFAFGGGYAAMPLIQNLVVEGKGWLSMAEYADLTTIAEMTPGPIAVNSATFVGQKMAGLPGAIVCTLGCILPSLIIVLTLAWFYTKYRELRTVKAVLAELRPAVVAMIAGAGLTILLLALFGTSSLSEISGIHPVETVLFVCSLFLLRKFKTNPILIILGTAVIGTAVYLIL